jgi:5-(carboxyamino)imidazole ribonucleotide mutase
MPAGVPVATVAVDGAENAAILAVQILSLEDDILEAKLSAMKADMSAKAGEKDRQLQEKMGNKSTILQHE